MYTSYSARVCGVYVSSPVAEVDHWRLLAHRRRLGGGRGQRHQRARLGLGHGQLREVLDSGLRRQQMTALSVFVTLLALGPSLHGSHASGGRPWHATNDEASMTVQPHGPRATLTATLASPAEHEPLPAPLRRFQLSPRPSPPLSCCCASCCCSSASAARRATSDHVVPPATAAASSWLTTSESRICVRRVHLNIWGTQPLSCWQTHPLCEIP